MILLTKGVIYFAFILLYNVNNNGFQRTGFYLFIVLCQLIRYCIFLIHLKLNPVMKTSSKNHTWYFLAAAMLSHNSWV